MTSIVVLVLVGAWAGYLFLWWKDSRSGVSPRRDGIGSFSRQLGSLAGGAARSGRPTVDLTRAADLSRPPRTTDDAARRRRDVLAALGALALLSLVTVPFLGSVALTAHVLIDMALLSYGYAVVRRRHLSAEKEIKVRMLYPDRPGLPQPLADAVPFAEAVTEPVVVPMKRTVNG